MDITELIKQARDDPALLSKINAVELLRSVKNDFLENQTIE